jgi:hypothetical protein
VVLLIAALIGMLAPAVSAGADTPRLGHGQWTGGWYFGYRTTVVNGHTYKIWCLVITGSVPFISKITTVNSITSLALANGSHVSIGATRSAEFRTVFADDKVNANLANAKTVDNEAAAVYSALNHIVWDGVTSKDSTAFHRAASSSSTWVKNEASRLVNEAKAHHGKSVLTLKVTHTPAHVGDLGTVVAHITNNPAGRVVHFGSNNGFITATAKTNNNGDAAVHFLPAHAGNGGLSATVAGVTPSTFGVANYRAGQQEMTTQSPRIKLHASASFTTSLHKLALNCPVTCDGTNVPVTGTVAHNYASSGYWHVSATVQRTTNGTTTTVSLGKVAIAPGKTVSHTWRPNNGDKNLTVTLSGTWGGHSFSITIAKLAVVDCPPFVSFTVAQTLFCGKCQSVSLQSGVNTGLTTATFTFTYNDGVSHTATYTVAPGTSLPATSLKVNSSSVTWTVTESVPFLTHSGPRTETANGTVTIS